MRRREFLKNTLIAGFSATVPVSLLGNEKEPANRLVTASDLSESSLEDILAGVKAFWDKEYERRIMSSAEINDIYSASNTEL